MRQFEDEVASCPDDGARLREFQSNATRLLGAVLDGRWELLSKIGEGGMGEVYRARQVNVDREVAVKILRLALASGEQYVARFFREADIASTVKNPHFVSIHDFGQTEDQLLYIAMELLEGESLGAKLRRQRIDLLEALTVAEQVCSALSAAHAAQIVHRDLKPDNIFLLEVPGGDTFVKVLDFGIAKDLSDDDQMTRTGQLFGTPEYMSPEQCEAGPVDGRSDLYALGCVLYETLTGQSPFRRGATIKTLLAQVGESATPFATLGVPVPVGVEAIVMRLLEKHPDNRFPNALAAREALLAEIEHLRANSGEVHVYETVSSTIAPRERSAHTISYGELGHPVHLEGILSAEDHDAIEARASARRLEESERETTQVNALGRRMPTVAFACIVVGGAAWFATRDNNAVVPQPTVVPLAAEQVRDAWRRSSRFAEMTVVIPTRAEARRTATSVAVQAASIRNVGRASAPRQPAKSTPKSVAATTTSTSNRAGFDLPAGIGVRTQTSMNQRVLGREIELLDCYNQRTDPGQQGRVTLKFQIQKDGTLVSVDATSQQITSTDVLDCMRAAVQDLRFYPGTGATVFEKSLVFSSR